MKHRVIILIVTVAYTLVQCQQTPPKVNSVTNDVQYPETPPNITSTNNYSSEEFVKELTRSLITGDTAIFNKFLPNENLELQLRYGDSILHRTPSQIELLKKRVFSGNNLYRNHLGLAYDFNRIHNELKRLEYSPEASVQIVKVTTNPANPYVKIPTTKFQVSVSGKPIPYSLALDGCVKTETGWRLQYIHEMTDVSIKLYDNTGRVDLKKSSQYSLGDYVRFNELDTTFIASYMTRDNALFEVSKENKIMKITTINRFDSVFFQEGEFFCPTAKKNTHFRRITIGNTIFKEDPDYKLRPIDTTLFKTEPIQKGNFLALKRRFGSKINPDTSKVLWTDTTFTLKIGQIEDTSQLTWTFNSIHSRKRWHNYYSGMIEPLNLYIVTWVDEIMGYYLIEPRKMILYNLEIAPVYEGVGSFAISPKNNFLLAYMNANYSEGSFISIFKVRWKSSGYSLSDFGGLRLDGSPIKEVIWINESNFAIHREDETYLKVTFK